jgi:hypothetical protein
MDVVLCLRTTRTRSQGDDDGQFFGDIEGSGSAESAGALPMKIAFEVNCKSLRFSMPRRIQGSISNGLQAHAPYGKRE